jgi:DNA-binding LacI/PurR family transcriptional regulator
MGSTAITLADVAAHLGVSRTTVSNAYNRPNQLSPALREKVLAAASELGYCGPDPMARGLRRGQTGSLGLVFDQPLTYVFTDPAAALFLQGMAAGIEEHGAALAIIPRVPDGPERSADLVRSALVDGYMLFCTATDDPRLRAVRARGLPYVLIEYDDDPTAAHVQIDDIAGATAAARHVVDLGHRRVGIVMPHGIGGVASGPEAQASTGWRQHAGRLAGWRAGVEAGGIDWAGVPVSSTGSAVGDGARAAGALLDRA